MENVKYCNDDIFLHALSQHLQLVASSTSLRGILAEWSRTANLGGHSS
jgi:hypothetical protein